MLVAMYSNTLTTILVKQAGRRNAGLAFRR